MNRIENAVAWIDEKISGLTHSHALSIQALLYAVIGGTVTYYTERLIDYIASLF